MRTGDRVDGRRAVGSVSQKNKGLTFSGSNPCLVGLYLHGGGFAGFVGLLDLAADSIHGTFAAFAYILVDSLSTVAELSCQVIRSGAGVGSGCLSTGDCLLSGDLRLVAQFDGFILD